MIDYCDCAYSKKEQLIAILQIKNNELQQDNFALSNQVFRLREIVYQYQKVCASYLTTDQFHNEQIQNNNKNAKDIIGKIQETNSKTKQQISKKFKQLKKEVFYKKYDNLQVKYFQKNKQCEQLLTFKDKILRIRNSWQVKKQDKKNEQISLQELFIWVYNHIVKAKTIKPFTGRKESSKKQDKGKQNQSISKNASYATLKSTKSKNLEQKTYRNSKTFEKSKVK